ncbi:glycosyltransferase family 2 protein [Halioglobus sp.]|nr:glycosyltransferase family 2 protein [Halioglobus sp.]
MPVADIIVPVFNEEDILEQFYSRVSNLGLDLNLIFIDNASVDSSLSILESFQDVTIIRHQSNEGYGSSLVDGMCHGRCENIIIIDADCEYPPEAIPHILEELRSSDIVYTSRLLHRKSAEDANMPYLKLLGNRIISGLFNILFDQNTTDLYTGCKGFKRDCIKGVSFSRMGFEHVLEFACTLSSRGYSIVDIPVVFEPRNTGTSKMSHLSETLKFLYVLALMKLTLSREKKTEL